MWVDSSGLSNNVVLSNVAISTEFGGIVTFKGTSDSFARSASLAAGTLGQSGQEWTGACIVGAGDLPLRAARTLRCHMSCAFYQPLCC